MGFENGPRLPYEVRFYGNIPNTEFAITTLAKKLSDEDATLAFVYEAGPCGYVVHRLLSDAGYRCDVIAPSLIPKKAGDRVKTDRRDAQMLARLRRTGELTNVWVPGPEQEAIRNLSRLREDMKEQERHMNQRLSAFLLRSGISRPEKIPGWSPQHFNWLKGLKFSEPIQQIVFQEYVDAAVDCEKRVAAAMGEIERALMGLRGVDITTAFTIVAERGDLSRFETASQMMAYLGLVPSEASSGGTVQRGGITKTGNGHVRKVLL